jgi:hypothetical protein
VSWIVEVDDVVTGRWGEDRTVAGGCPSPSLSYKLVEVVGRDGGWDGL